MVEFVHVLCVAHTFSFRTHQFRLAADTKSEWVWFKMSIVETLLWSSSSTSPFRLLGAYHFFKWFDWFEAHFRQTSTSTNKKLQDVGIN